MLDVVAIAAECNVRDSPFIAVCDPTCSQSTEKDDDGRHAATLAPSQGGGRWTRYIDYQGKAVELVPVVLGGQRRAEIAEPEADPPPPKEPYPVLSKPPHGTATS